MSLGMTTFGGAEDSDFLSGLSAYDPGINTAPRNIFNVGAFGRQSGNSSGLSNVLGLGNPTRGIFGGMENTSEMSSPERPFYGRQGEELGRGSIRGRLGRKGFELRTPKNVNESSQILSTEYIPQEQAYRNGFSFGGNENLLDFNYDTSASSILAQSGFAGGRLSGDGSIQADTRYGNLNDFSTSAEYSTPSSYGRTYGRSDTEVSGSVASPEDFSYNNTINQRVVGGARTGSQRDSKTEGDSYGGQVAAYYDTPQQIGYGILSAGLGMIPGVGQLAGYLTAPIGQALFGGPTVVTRDFASAKSAAQQNLGASAGLTGEGNISIGRNANVGGLANAKSPVFGNEVTAGVDINTSQGGDLSLRGDGVAGSLGMDSNQLAEASAGLQQTNLFRKGGAILKGMNKNTFAPMGYQGITQNSGGQLALTGQKDNASGLANINQRNDIELINDIQASDKGFNGRYRNPLGQNAISEENIAAELKGRADVLGAANNELGLYNSAIGGGGSMRADMKAQSQAAIETALKSAGAKIDAYSKAKQLLQGDLNNEISNSVRVEAERFTDNIAQKFPNSPAAQAVIDFIKQDPANAWLFTGDNSPEVIMSAMASSKSATGGGYYQAPNYYGTGNYLDLTRNDVNANITIDPNANTNIQRYYTHDPTPADPASGDEMVFANINGEVREIPKGQLADINFRDQFNINAKSEANNASAELGVKGNVKGVDYYFANGNDEIYNQLANEVVARSENTWNKEGVDMVNSLKNVNSEMEKAQNNLSNLAKQYGTAARIQDPNISQTGSLAGGLIYKNNKTGDVYWVFPSVEKDAVSVIGNTKFTVTKAIPTIENPYTIEQNKISKLSGSQADLTQKIQQNTQANQTTQNDPIIQQLNQLKTKNLSAEDKVLLNELMDQRVNELNQQYEGRASEARNLSSQLDQAFEAYQNLKNINPSQITDVGKFQTDLANAEQNMTALSNQLKSLNQELSTNRPDITKVGYNDVRDQFMAGRDASRYADQYDRSGNAMINNRSVADYEDVLNMLQRERDFDNAQGIAQGGNYINLDSINAKARANQNALIDRGQTWYQATMPGGIAYGNGQTLFNNIGRSASANSILDPTTGNLVNSGDSNLFNRTKLTGYDPSILNDNIYDPLNLSLSTYGVDQYFDPIRFHNDSNWHRLMRNRVAAVDSANANMIQGNDFYRTGL